MKRKMEFLLFYLLWVAACLSLVLSLSVEHELVRVSVGVGTFPVLLGFTYINSGAEEPVCALLKPLLFLLLAAVCVSAIVSRDVMLPCMLAIQALILWRVERGYVYEHTYES